MRLIAVSPDVLAIVPAPSVSAFRVVHSMRGRVRIVFERPNEYQGLRLARRLARHREVRALRWSPAARSLTVQFAAGRRFEQILEELPDEVPYSAPIVVREPVATHPLGLLSLALDLLSGRAPITFILDLLTPDRQLRLT